MSDPVPNEDMFLLLVKMCGIPEAKFWADALGLEHRQSYSRLYPLLAGEA
jgi:hypothetical protein